MTEQQTKINERAVLAAVIAEGAGGKGQTEAQTAEYLDELAGARQIVEHRKLEMSIPERAVVKAAEI